MEPSPKKEQVATAGGIDLKISLAFRELPANAADFEEELPLSPQVGTANAMQERFGEAKLTSFSELDRAFRGERQLRHSALTSHRIARAESLAWP